jgi:hypothetical protein
MITVPGVVAAPGGLPIRSGGKIIGAVGVSGGTGDQDEQCAKAGLAAFGTAPSDGTASETYSGSNVDARTILYFKVSPTALSKFLPEGWELSPVTTGPAAGANLEVELVDQLWAVGADGVVDSPYRYVLFGMPVRKKGSDSTNLMLIDGLSPGGAGPYGIAEKAADNVQRTVRYGSGGASAEQSWEFKGGGEAVSLKAQFDEGQLAREKSESHVYSQVKPQFSRIYRYDERMEVVRGAGVAAGRLKSFTFKAEGGKLAGIFDGSEQLIAFISVPSYSRDIYVPVP